ncbi:MAG: hypothetical protein K8R23_02430 [Chthoniobacter sp.]|nr:hypothetical protein [Chthoniobacter sp.]
MLFLALIQDAFSQKAAGGDDWLQGVTELTSSGNQAFQFQARIGDPDARAVIVNVSYAPHNRRCVIIRDSFDGLPLMIAADGTVWIYDPIGRQILTIRAEPEFLFETNAGKLTARYGMRAEFPDPASHTTIRLKFGTVMRAVARDKPDNLAINREPRVAEFKDGKASVKLLADAHNPARAIGFSIETGDDERRLALRFESFFYDAPLPAWHREINQAALSRHVTTRAVRHAASFAPDVQEKMEKIKTLLQGSSLFILRAMLRNAELRRGFERNSPVALDFGELKANDDALRGPWIKALQEQGFNLPPIETPPSAREKVLSPAGEGR